MVASKAQEVVVYTHSTRCSMPLGPESGKFKWVGRYMGSVSVMIYFKPNIWLRTLRKLLIPFKI